MKFLIDNKSIQIHDAELSFIKQLDKRTSFYVLGHEFNPAYRRRMWDGREHLLKRAKTGYYTLPIGMVDRANELADEMECDVETVDLRRPLSPQIEVNWNPAVVPRDYQEDAATQICSNRGVLTGKGMIRVPTRGGKTVIAARAIYRLKLRTLFIVPSQLLMTQTIASFENTLMVKIGHCGDGTWNPLDITVATIQTLASKGNQKATEELLKSFDVVFFDECHHLKGEKWRNIFSLCEAMYKIGLSATIFLKDQEDNDISAIWMVASTGPVLYTIAPDELIRRGYLIRPKITCVALRAPEVKGRGWQSAYREGIIEHKRRNELIVWLAQDRRKRGRSILIITSKIDHTEILQYMLIEAGLTVGKVTGPTPAEERARILARFNEDKVDVLIGTVFGEGIDIPKIEVVINAEGGKSQISSTQKFRNITPAPGKEIAEMIDFMDLHNKYLAGHSLERLLTYKEHEEFKFSLVQADDLY